MTTAKEERKKLEQTLHSQQQDHELTISRLEKKHTSVTRGLEEQVCSIRSVPLLRIVIDSSTKERARNFTQAIPQ